MTTHEQEPAPTTAAPTPFPAPLATGSAMVPVAPGGPGPMVGPVTGQAMKRRNVVAVWFGLPVITLGIYGFVWWYKVNAELGRLDPRRPVSAGTSLLAVTLGAFLVIPPYVSVYNTGKRIAERQRVAGIGSSCSPVIGLLLCFVFGLYSLYYQSELNKINHHFRAAPGAPVPLAF